MKNLELFGLAANLRRGSKPVNFEFHPTRARSSTSALVNTLRVLFVDLSIIYLVHPRHVRDVRHAKRTITYIND